MRNSREAEASTEPLMSLELNGQAKEVIARQQQRPMLHSCDSKPDC
jgi:hypothetical protein